MNVEKNLKEEQKGKTISSIKEPWEEVLQEYLVERPNNEGEEIACPPEIMDSAKISRKAELIKSLQSLQYQPKQHEPLKKYLNLLPLSQFIVLYGFYWRGMSLKEVSEELNKKKNAIKALKSKGLSNLKKLLETSEINSAKSVRPQKTVLANAKRGVTLETAQTLCRFRGKRRNF